MVDQGKSSSTVVPINTDLPNNAGIIPPPPNPLHIFQFSRCVLALLSCVLLFALCIVCSILAIPPKPNVYISSMVLSGLNVSTGAQTAFSTKWELGFLLTNIGQKTKLPYSGTRVSVFYGNALFGETRMKKSFYQEKKIEMAVKVDGYVMENRFKGEERNVGAGLAVDLKKGVVNFGVEWYNWKNGDGFSGYLVSCPDVSILITSGTNGTMLGGAKQCDVSTSIIFAR